LVIIVLLELYDPLLVQTEPSGVFQVLRRYLTVTHVALERYVLEMPLRCPSTFPLAKHPAFLLAFLVPLGTFVIGLLRFRWFVPQVFFALTLCLHAGLLLLNMVISIISEGLAEILDDDLKTEGAPRCAPLPLPLPLL